MVNFLSKAVDPHGEMCKSDHCSEPSAFDIRSSEGEDIR